MLKTTHTLLSGFFFRYLTHQSSGWGNPLWAQQELERLMQWHALRLPAVTYKRHF